MSDSLWLHGLQHARPPCPLLSLGVCSSSCPFNRWCHSTSLSSVIPFSLCLQSFPASGTFPMSVLFPSGGQSFKASASASVLSMSVQGWFPLGLTGLISLLSKGLSRVFSSTTVQRQVKIALLMRKSQDFPLTSVSYEVEQGMDAILSNTQHCCLSTVSLSYSLKILNVKYMKS